MNALDNENDPFEDVFRNRFADFESEPDFQLWNKIEPQLPVNPTRRFPYWQISAVAIIMLLSGLSVHYFSVSSKESNTTSAEVAQKEISKKANKSILPKGEKQREVSRVEVSEQLSSDVPSLEKIKTTSIPTTRLISVDGETKNSDNVLNHIVIGAKSSIKNENYRDIESGKSKNSYAVAEGQSKKYSKNLKDKLNLFDSKASKTSIAENYQIPNSNNFDSRDNKSPQLDVFSSNKVFTLGALESKDYRLLSNNLKTLKLKNVLMPKAEEYFKESKPIDMYFSIMPLLNYYTITPNGNDANYVHGIAVNDDGDRLGFYTQGGVIFTLSDRFKLRTGLTFTKTNHSISYQVRTDSLVVQSPDNKGVDVSFAEINKTYSHTANYLGTKIELQYLFLKGEALTHYLNVGFEGAYRLNGNNQFNGFANIAYGITRQIGDNAYLFVEPTFSYSLNQQSDNNAFLLVKPNKIGFNIGVNFKIK